MRASQQDLELLARLPRGRWFAAGALSIHPSRLTRLVRLGLLARRACPLGLLVSRTWDYWKD